MEPVKFPNSNGVLASPKGHEAEVGAMPVHRASLDNDTPVVISCWQLSDAEIEAIKINKIIWLWVWGNTHAPLLPDVNNPFEEKADTTVTMEASDGSL